MSVKVNQRRKNHYHGHVCLEFKSARTGIRERIEHDNDFTDGIDKFLTCGGRFNNAPWANSDWRALEHFKTLTGGVFLFDKAISQVSNKYPTTMPAGTKMTANGSYGVSNSTTVTEMGSFNTNESSFTRNSLTYVYDWSTQQGNGDIGSVCLTSNVGGYIGYGNSVSNLAHETKKALDDNQSYTAYPMSALREKCTFDYDNGFICNIISNTTTDMTLEITDIAVDEVSLYDYITYGRTVQFPSALTGSTPVVFAGAPGEIVVFRSGIPTGASSFTFGVYNIKNDSWQVHTLPYAGTSNLSQLWNYFFFVKDGFYFKGYGNDPKLMYWWSDLSNPVEVTLGNVPLNISDGIVIGSNGVVIDRVNKTNYLCNANVATFNINSSSISYSQDNHVFGIRNNMAEAFRNPLYLATVANLDNVVTKTSSQTMKLMYTVTRV